MKFVQTLIALFLSTCLPQAAGAAELKVSRADVIQPDAQLQATVAELKSLAARARKKDIKRVEAFFAPDVKTFSRGLDPFQPWHAAETLTGKYLKGMAALMVEQGVPEDGAPSHDFRIDAMQMLAGSILADGTFGALPEVPGSICAPAAYQVDREAATAFARKFKLDAYSTRFYDVDAFLAGRPKSNKGTPVPAHTLIIFDHDPEAPEGWAYFETAGGVKGYMKDRDDALGLAQNHVCFARVKGRYRITAIFGYGL